MWPALEAESTPWEMVAVTGDIGIRPLDVVRLQPRLSILTEAGLRVIRLHNPPTLQVAAAEPPRVVQNGIRHPSIQITLDIASHAIPSMHADGANTLDAISRPPSTGRLSVDDHDSRHGKDGYS